MFIANVLTVTSDDDGFSPSLAVTDVFYSDLSHLPEFTFEGLRGRWYVANIPGAIYNKVASSVVGKELFGKIVFIFEPRPAYYGRYNSDFEPLHLTEETVSFKKMVQGLAWVGYSMGYIYVYCDNEDDLALARLMFGGR